MSLKPYLVEEERREKAVQKGVAIVICIYY